MAQASGTRKAGAAGAGQRPRQFTRALLEKFAQVVPDPQAALRSLGIHGQLPDKRTLERLDLEGPELQSLYARCMAAIEAQVVRRTSRPTYTAEDAAVMCYCAISGSTLAHAIDHIAKFFAALARASGRPGLSALSVHVRDGRAELDMYNAAPANDDGAFLSALMGAALLKRLFEWLIGRSIESAEARTAFVRGIAEQAVAELFPHPITFGCSDLGPGCDFRVSFPSFYLRRPVVRVASDVEHFNIMDLLFSAPTPVELPVLIRRIISAALVRAGPLPNTQRLASLCNRSAATLRRHLARAGTSIRAIREECVRQHALQLLEDGDLPLGKIATRLGFSDAPCFRRAFRRWTGQSPAAFRRRARPGAEG